MSRAQTTVVADRAQVQDKSEVGQHQFDALWNQQQLLRCLHFFQCQLDAVGFFSTDCRLARRQFIERFL